MPAQPFANRPPRTWTRITIQVAPAMTETVAAFLADLTGSGVEITSARADAAALPVDDQVIGYLTPAESTAQFRRLEIFLKDLAQFFPATAPALIEQHDIQEEDWGEQWKKNFKTFRISPRLIIKPSWEIYRPRRAPKAGDEAVLELDPGLAFGTGHHASTSLALLLIDRLYSPGAAGPRRVLDIGTGTGILAMACALFGAREVLAVDNDPDAVTAARDNIRRNALDQRVTASLADIGGLDHPFDLIVANITHDILLQLAPSIVRLLAAGAGRLILSGLLAGPQAESITLAYGRLGLALIASESAEEWTALQFALK